MKLYTADQVKILLNALTDIKNWDEELEDEWEDCGYRAIDALNNFSDVNEIELPSDEEMANASNHCKDGQVKVGFLRGVLWYQEQILNQNK